MIAEMASLRSSSFAASPFVVTPGDGGFASTASDAPVAEEPGVLHSSAMHVV